MTVTAIDWDIAPAKGNFRLRSQTFVERFTQKPHNVGEHYWTLNFTLPPLNDDRTRLAETSLYNLEGVNVLRVYDPRRITPKAHPLHTSIQQATCVSMHRPTKTIRVIVPERERISTGDAVSFKTTDGVVHYFHAARNAFPRMDSNGAPMAVSLMVNPRPRRSETFAPIVLERRYARCCFYVDLNSVAMNTETNLYSDISLQGIEYIGAIA